MENIRDVTDGVAVRKKVPAARAVAVIVEPRAEDEVGGDTQEESG